jgi:hypothetical protein
MLRSSLGDRLLPGFVTPAFWSRTIVRLPRFVGQRAVSSAIAGWRTLAGRGAAGRGVTERGRVPRRCNLPGQPHVAMTGRDDRARRRQPDVTPGKPPSSATGVVGGDELVAHRRACPARGASVPYARAAREGAGLRQGSALEWLRWPGVPRPAPAFRAYAAVSFEGRAGFAASSEAADNVRRTRLRRTRLRRTRLRRTRLRRTEFRGHEGFR